MYMNVVVLLLSTIFIVGALVFILWAAGILEIRFVDEEDSSSVPSSPKKQLTESTTSSKEQPRENTTPRSNGSRTLLEETLRNARSTKKDDMSDEAWSRMQDGRDDPFRSGGRL